ncbi:MAG TPA: CSLREA domain-containing protein [Pyrinomonadaceae bacterium]|jgi:CSLREA domain-containing protein
MALEQNVAEPLSLATADFDEDGMPDLVAGYAYNGRGIITLHRGNVDSIYQNAPEAKRRRANGTFTDAPFLSPATVFESSVAPDFLGAGDFDADGHWDIVLARRSETSLHLLAGNGTGWFNLEKEVSVNGQITAFATGEVNRRDGLTDLVVGLVETGKSHIAIFEGPLGALRSAPEMLTLLAPAMAVDIGEVDDDYAMDVVVAAGNRLVLVHGRDRKLSLSPQEQAGVRPVQVSDRRFDFDLRSVAIGEFSGDGSKDVALLSADGALLFLTKPALDDKEWARIKQDVENYTAGGESNIGKRRADPNAPARVLPQIPLSQWQLQSTSNQKWPGAQALVKTRQSSVAADSLVLLGPHEQQLHIVANIGQTNTGWKLEPQSNVDKAVLRSWQTLSLEMATRPAAVLPMRLDSDALSDLIILRQGAAAPSVALTANQSDATAAPPLATNYATFTKDEFILVDTFSGVPGKGSPYPSTIEVSGITDPNAKIRVTLNRINSWVPNSLELVLVSPAGQKVMLMSDTCGSTLSGVLYLTFDDSAPAFLPTSGLPSGSYKPTNVDDGSPDVFPSPGPTAPFASTLSTFNGNDLNGTWKLFVVLDTASPGNSQFQDGWTLTFGDDPPSQDFVVNSTADTDDATCNAANCTLREAINAANAKPGADRIIFNIDPGTGGGLKTITPQTSLPSLTEAVTIDGTTQPGFSGAPIIELNGSNVGGDGLVLLGGNSVVRGLVVNRFGDEGIVLLQGTSSIVEGNYIGTDPTGTLDRGNTNSGLDIDTANNTIGGTTTAARNLISGNNYNGIIFGTFYSDPAENNVIAGNYIGTNAAGTAALGNTFSGISFNSAPGSPNNQIGGTMAGARNIIAGGNDRIQISYVGSSSTLVQGNFIGTDVSGTVALSTSGGGGVELDAGVGDCLIGGTTPAARNLLSGNWYGVFINTNNLSSPPPVRNLVQGNFIGTRINGTAALANIFSGVRLIFGATSNTIGGAVVEARNIISGNQKAGVQIGEINQASTFTNVIQNNYIGTDFTGNNPLANGNNVDPSGGIIIPANADGDQIRQNRIAYNLGSGIRITNVTGNNQPGIRITIVDNEIFANTKLGIDLGDAGITPNDPQDTDSGPNTLQNFPVLTSAVATVFGETIWERAGEVGQEMPDPILAAALTVNGTLNSTPNTNFTVHWYFSADAQCTTNQAASRPLVLGKVPDVITNGSGNATFSIPFDFPSGINNGIINCTATDPQGNTSEFSACFPVGTSPGPTPTPTPTPAATPTPTPTPAPPPTIFVETGTNNLAAVDSVTLVRGPFALTNTRNYSSDQRTRIIFFTTDLGFAQSTQPDINTLSVQVGVNSYTVESVGPNSTISGSEIVFRLPDLSPSTYPLGIRLRGVNSANTPNLQIVGSPSSPAAAPKSTKPKLVEYLLFSILDLIL